MNFLADPYGGAYTEIADKTSSDYVLILKEN